MALSQRAVIRRIRLLMWMFRLQRRKWFAKANVPDRNLQRRLESPEIDRLIAILDIPREVWNIKSEATFVRTVQARNRTRRERELRAREQAQRALPVSDGGVSNIPEDGSGPLQVEWDGGAGID